MCLLCLVKPKYETNGFLKDETLSVAKDILPAGYLKAIKGKVLVPGKP